ncbi:MAG: hypothetical protein IH959_05480 [Chloroflexi bacterium]|nr:hypothetical protein [Chloroflexota bacterium]
MIHKLREFIEGSRGSLRVRGVVLVTVAATVVGLALMATMVWTGGDSASASHRQSTPTNTPIPGTATNTPLPPTATATPKGPFGGKRLVAPYLLTATVTPGVAVATAGVTVTCNSGDVAIGGGASTDKLDEVAITESSPDNDPPDGWNGAALEVAVNDATDWTLTVYVICAEVEQP